MALFHMQFFHIDSAWVAKGRAMRWRRMAVVGLASAALAGCVAGGTLYPANDLARTLGVLQARITKAGMGSGPISITMPNGEVLAGRYSVNVGGSVGFGSVYSSVYGAGGSATGSGFGYSSAISTGSPGGRHGVEAGGLHARHGGPPLGRRRDVEDRQVVLRRRGWRDVAAGGGELEVVGRAGAADHHAVEAVMVVEAGEDGQGKAGDVEGHQGVDVVGGAGDAEGCRAVLSRPGGWSAGCQLADVGRVSEG